MRLNSKVYSYFNGVNDVGNIKVGSVLEPVSKYKTYAISLCEMTGYTQLNSGFFIFVNNGKVMLNSSEYFFQLGPEDMTADSRRVLQLMGDSLKSCKAENGDITFSCSYNSSTSADDLYYIQVNGNVYVSRLNDANFKQLQKEKVTIPANIMNVYTVYDKDKGEYSWYAITHGLTHIRVSVVASYDGLSISLPSVQNYPPVFLEAVGFPKIKAACSYRDSNGKLVNYYMNDDMQYICVRYDTAKKTHSIENGTFNLNHKSACLFSNGESKQFCLLNLSNNKKVVTIDKRLTVKDSSVVTQNSSYNSKGQLSKSENQTTDFAKSLSVKPTPRVSTVNYTYLWEAKTEAQNNNYLSLISNVKVSATYPDLAPFSGKKMMLSETGTSYKETNRNSRYIYTIEEHTSKQDTTTYSTSKIIERNSRGNITLARGVVPSSSSNPVKTRYMYVKNKYTSTIPIAIFNNINFNETTNPLKYDASYIGFETFEAFTKDTTNKKISSTDFEITNAVIDTVAYVGDACAKFTASGSVKIKTNKVSLVSDKEYILSYWYKSSASSEWQYCEDKLKLADVAADGKVKDFANGTYIDQLSIRPIDSSILINVYDSNKDLVIANIGDRGDTIFHVFDTYDIVPFSFKNKMEPISSENKCNITNKISFNPITLNGIYAFNGFNVPDGNKKLNNKCNNVTTIDVFGDGYIINNTKSAIDFTKSTSFALSGYNNKQINQEFTIKIINDDKDSSEIRLTIDSNSIQLMAGAESKEVNFVQEKTRWFIVVFREMLLIYFNNKQVVFYKLPYNVTTKRIEVEKEGQTGDFAAPIPPTSDTLNDPSYIYVADNIMISSGFTDLSGNVIQTQHLAGVDGDPSTKVIINGSAYGGYGQKILSTLNATMEIDAQPQNVLVYKDDFINGTLANEANTSTNNLSGYLIDYYKDDLSDEEFAFPEDELFPFQRLDYYDDALHRVKQVGGQGKNHYAEGNLYNLSYSKVAFKDLYGYNLNENSQDQKYVDSILSTGSTQTIKTNFLYDAQDSPLGSSRYVDENEKISSLRDERLLDRSDGEISMKNTYSTPNHFAMNSFSEGDVSKEVRKYGRLVTTTNPDSGSKSIISDIFGLTRIVVLNDDFRKSIYYKYDKLSRLKECGTVDFGSTPPTLPNLVYLVDDPNYPTTGGSITVTACYRYTYDYDASSTNDIMFRGRLVKIEDVRNAVNTTYKYDTLGHKIEFNTNSKPIQYEYNNQGIVTKETYPFTNTTLKIGYNYDEFKRLNKIVKLGTDNAELDTYVQDCIYDMNGRLTQYKKKYDITETSKYDFYHNLKELNCTRRVDAQNETTLLKQEFEYCYDNAVGTDYQAPYFYQNNIYKITESNSLTGTEQKTVKTYDYNYLYKFINESGNFSKYYYDNNGNLQYKDGKLYILKDGKNQIDKIIDKDEMAITYNSYGDVGRLSLNSVASHDFTWDSFFIHSFNTCSTTDKNITIGYDYTGSRWKKEVKDKSNNLLSSLQYYYGLYRNPVLTVDKNSKMVANIYLFDTLALQIHDDTVTNPVVYMADYKGSIRVGQNGTAQANSSTFQYDEFGLLVSNSSTNYPLHMFENMEYDSELLMYNENGKLYHPGYGVYLSYTRGNGHSPYVFM